MERLPSPLDGYANAVAKVLSCSAGQVATAMLVALSAVVGNTRVLNVNSSWSEPCVVWAGLVSPPGSLKTPILKEVFSPIEAIQEQSFADFEEQVKTYNEAKHTFEAELKKFESELKKGKNSTPPIEPTKPTYQRLTIGDATGEALVNQLTVNRRSLTLYRDELSGWFGGMGQYKKGDADIAQALELFNAGTIEIDRKGGNPPVTRIRNAFCSILGGIQPKALQRALGERNRDNGLASRFLFSFPPDGPVMLQSAGVPQVTKRAWSDTLTNIYHGLPLNLNELGNPLPTPIHLEPEAKEAFHTIFEEIEIERTSEVSFDEKSFLAKMRGYVLRIALLLHTAEQAQKLPVTFDPFETVSVKTLMSAKRIMWWYYDEAREVFSFFRDAMVLEKTKPMDEGLILKIHHHFLRQKSNGRCVTARGLRNSYRKDFSSTNDAAAFLDTLVNCGYVNRIGEGRSESFLWTSESV